MGIYQKPYLQKYTGRSSRHKCPACGDNFCFAYYLDGNTNEIIHRSVGRCNHESSCGYHYTPKQYFIDNPTEYERPSIPQPVRKPEPVKAAGTIPFSYVQKVAGYKSDFVFFLCSLFDRSTLESPTIEMIMDNYALGALRDGSVVFWQIDINGKVRTGKIMKYNRETGRRIKEYGGINWVHSVMKKTKNLPEDYNLQQCLFGEHLLRIYPYKTVALVESEKSALIASGCYPEYIWLATGGKSQLSKEKLKVLKGRTVIMFPDIDGFSLWKEKSNILQAMGCTVVVSDILERNATDKDRANKIDLADWLISELQKSNGTNVITSSHNEILNSIRAQNTAIDMLIDKFDLMTID